MSTLPNFALHNGESGCVPITKISNTRGLRGLRGLGLGSAQQTNAIIGASASVAGSVGAIIAATGAIPVAGPFIAAAAALTEVISSFFQGCGNTCVEATQIVNQIEPYLQQNLANYLALPIPRTQAEQQAAEAVFNNAWAEVTSTTSGCGNPALGTAGQNCISQRGPNGSIPNHPGVNWFTLYYDPIANDPNVAPNTTATDLVSGNGVTNLYNYISGMGVNPLWLILAFVGVGVFMFTGNKGN